MKKTILIFSIAIMAVMSSVDAQITHTHHLVYCSKDNSKAYHAIKKLPEVQELVNKILEDGSICIESNHRETSGFQGMWDSRRRKVVMNPYTNPTLGERINTLMMELHNAASDRQLSHLFRQAQAGRLTKDEYVEGVERVEHANAVGSSRLLALGIRRGFYPGDAAWDIYDDFDDHYMLQQVLDHSTWIAMNYNHLNPRGRHQKYHGTVPNLSKLSENDKNIICRYLSIKNNMKSPSREVKERAQQRFARELSRIRSGGRGMWSRNQN
nr:hypothetical protein [Chlamydiota bacterium]